MKKFLAMILALAMVFALCACGAETAAPAQSPAAEESASTATEAPAESAETDEFTWRDYDLSGEITIYGEPTSFSEIQQYLEGNGFEVTGAEFTRIPNDLKEVTQEQRETIEKMVDLLEDDDDVQSVYTNMKPAE